MNSVLTTLTHLAQQGHIPQEVITELVTVLQDIYNQTLNGGHGSRKAVVQALIVLGLRPILKS